MTYKHTYYKPALGLWSGECQKIIQSGLIYPKETEIKTSFRRGAVWYYKEFNWRMFDKNIWVLKVYFREKEKKDYIGNLVVSKDQSFYRETLYTGIGFSGTGDLFASVICGSLVKGLSMQEAVERATYFLQEAIEEATKEKIPRNHGVNFEKYLSKLL